MKLSINHIRIIFLLMAGLCLTSLISAQSRDSNRPKSLAQAHYNRANAYKKEYRYIEALREYKKAIRIKPDYAEAYFQMGEIHRRNGDDETAITTYKQALRHKLNYIEAYKGLAWSYERSNRHAEAIATWNRLMKVVPDNPGVAHTAYVNMAEMYREDGDIDKAIETYDQLIAIHKRLIQEKADKAVFNPDIWAKYKAELYAKKGQYEDAIKSYEEAVSLASNTREAAWAYSEMGSLLYRLGRYKEAINAYLRVVELHPDWEDEHLALGMIYIKLGDRESALKEYEILRRLDQNKAELLLLQINR
jgi:tetratricopeptide (TPR) repeat protein